jgi:hypothetical protein
MWRPAVLKNIIYLFLIGLHLKGQGFSYAQTDNAVKDFSKRGNLTADSVVAFVNTHMNSTDHKLRAYYTFIALNIDYDVARLKELMILPTVPYNYEGPLHYSISQTPEEVFKYKKGVCEGISRLMCRFCEGSGIPCEMVPGYCKSPDGETIRDLGHAWNAVKCDSVWRLIDLTFAIGYMNEKGEFKRRISGDYFLVKPETFIKDHLPLDPAWQLSKTPVSKKYFFDNDSTAGKYFSSEFNFNDSIEALLKKKGFERNYQMLLNYQRYDRDDKHYSRNLDIFVNNYVLNQLTVSGIYFEDFVAFYNSTLTKNKTKANCSKALQMLGSSDKHLKEAERMLSSKRAFTEEFAPVWKDLAENIRKNKKAIANNSALIKDIQKKSRNENSDHRRR